MSAQKTAKNPIIWGLFVFIWLAFIPVAQAIPVLEEDEHTLNIDGSLKSYALAFHFSGYPDLMLKQMGLDKDEPWAGLGMVDLRLKIEGEHLEFIKWQIHYHSQPIFRTFGGLGGVGAVGFVSAAFPPRTLPLEVFSHNAAGFQWRHEIDRLNIRFRLGKVDLILGRQVISFGVGFVWKPADLVGTFSPMELDQEYKPGVDAIRMNIALGDFTELAAVFAFGGPRCSSIRQADGKLKNVLPNGDECSFADVRFAMSHSVGLARFRTNIKAFDVGVITGWVRGDVIGGLFLTGSLGRFRLRSEVVYTWDLEADGPAADSDWKGWNPTKDRVYAGQGNDEKRDRHFIRAVLGVDYKFNTSRTLMLFTELYYNGFGTTDSKDYLYISLQPRVAEFGEIFNNGQLYAAAGLTWDAHQKLEFVLTLMANLLDPSLSATIAMTYKVGDESVFVVSAILPFGEGPKLAELTKLVDTNPTNDLEVRSEFGLFPTIVNMQWKLYF